MARLANSSEPPRAFGVTRSVKWPALACVLLALACGSPALSPSTPAPVALTATGTTDGVTLRLDLDRASLTPGQEVWVTLTIENTNTRPIRWVGGGCNVAGRAMVTIPALSDLGRNWDYPFAELKKRLVTVAAPGFIPLLNEIAWQKRAAGGQVCTADVRINELAPKGRLVSRFLWDGMVAGSPAPNGAVTIMGSLDMDDPVAMVGKVVGASIPLPLGGGARTTVSAARAFDSALEDARFATWVRARFVQRGNSEAAAYDMGGGAHLDVDDWVITASQKTAPAGDIEVRVSAVDGKVRSVVSH